MVVAMAAIVAVGCTTHDPGTAEPTSTSGSSTVTLSRPKDLKIANIDPCTLLTDAQMAQMNISRKAPGSADPQGGATSGCSYQVTQPIAYTLDVSLEPKRGVEDWLAGKWTAPHRQTTVSSYPAVQTLLLGENFTDQNGTFCSTYVSTAQGQEISAGTEQHNHDLSIAQMCDLSKQLAGLALATLQANQ
jgi:Protein of unknown function (DUF3558)